MCHETPFWHHSLAGGLFGFGAVGWDTAALFMTEPPKWRFCHSLPLCNLVLILGDVMQFVLGFACAVAAVWKPEL